MVNQLHVVEERLDAMPEGKQALRLWLRLLTCSTMVEQRMRQLLKDEFNTTLPRFDLLAALDRAPDGLTMGELSRWLMVSNGNVTGVADRLEAEGLILRTPSPDDRRTQIVTITEKGRDDFKRMAAVHESWIKGLFSDLTPEDVESLMGLLAKAKQSVARNTKDNK
jgi:DNA-binding MarR family transcriptional regulator